MRLFFIFTFVFVFSVHALASVIPLTLSKKVLQNRELIFVEHSGPIDTPFANSLAMDVHYPPIQNLKLQIEKALNMKSPLKIFTGWNPEGEAHVTTITPPEFDQKLKNYVSPKRMNEIARKLKIQESDLKILGLGRGTKTLEGKLEETYFVIVQSENLIKIRKAIHKEFVSQGGKASDWNPEHFFPHITIGFTKRDLHENDGVIKDVEHSLDKRFKLELTPIQK